MASVDEMSRVLHEVVLHCEQTATLIVTAPEDATESDLTERALCLLDESGGAEWVSDCYTETRVLRDTGESAR